MERIFHRDFLKIWRCVYIFITFGEWYIYTVEWGLTLIVEGYGFQAVKSLAFCTSIYSHPFLLVSSALDGACKGYQHALQVFRGKRPWDLYPPKMYIYKVTHAYLCDTANPCMLDWLGEIPSRLEGRQIPYLTIQDAIIPLVRNVPICPVEFLLDSPAGSCWFMTKARDSGGVDGRWGVERVSERGRGGVEEVLGGRSRRLRCSGGSDAWDKGKVGTGGATSQKNLRGKAAWFQRTWMCKFSHRCSYWWLTNLEVCFKNDNNLYNPYSLPILLMRTDIAAMDAKE